MDYTIGPPGRTEDPAHPWTIPQINGASAYPCGDFSVSEVGYSFDPKEYIPITLQWMTLEEATDWVEERYKLPRQAAVVAARAFKARVMPAPTTSSEPPAPAARDQ